MMNYIKSEFYRVTHTKGIYYTAGILFALAVLLNTGIYYFGSQYATTSFSYSNLVALPMVFLVGGTIIAYFLYEGNKRNGNMKNTIAGGIPRTKVFLGECFVSLVVSTVIMVLTLSVWVISAELLLEKTGPVELMDLLSEVPAVYLIAAAGLCSGIVFLEIFEKNTMGILAWFSIWFIVPRILRYLGIRFEVIYDIAMWLPNNLFTMINGQHVNTQECITAWDTAGGLVKCVVSGSAGIVIFLLSGVILLRRKDL